MHYPFYAIDEEQRKETSTQVAFFTSPLTREYTQPESFPFQSGQIASPSMLLARLNKQLFVP